MLTQNRSFTLDKSAEQLRSEMEAAQQQNHHPQPAVTVEEDMGAATFSVEQRFANFKAMRLYQAVGTIHPVTENSTQIDVKIEYLTTAAIGLTVLQVIGTLAVYIAMQASFDPATLNFLVILSVVFTIWERVRYLKRFQDQMDALFGKQWR